MEFSSQLGDEICLELVKLQLHVLPESLHEGVKDGAAGMTTVLDVVGMLELSSGGSIMDPRPRDVAEPCILPCDLYLLVVEMTGLLFLNSMVRLSGCGWVVVADKRL